MTTDENDGGSNKRNKQEFLQFRGRRGPRVGQDFQVTALPSPATAATRPVEPVQKDSAAKETPTNTDVTPVNPDETDQSDKGNDKDDASTENRDPSSSQHPASS
eukprot:CAMPEP_0172452296 /NCGR_PEP_ID=MMETSP1065-20121228/10014_1 /TAXON_ID=265537 /ORGANISM="Amphiprora paludosa, Strain CCMP125" /LENGTH=103 /DNA_ID=CAMNT_0013204339 /DNA_START=32 /DNA_END=343 /DNA_ORIENTATION=-